MIRQIESFFLNEQKEEKTTTHQPQDPRKNDHTSIFILDSRRMVPFIGHERSLVYILGFHRDLQIKTRAVFLTKL